MAISMAISAGMNGSQGIVQGRISPQTLAILRESHAGWSRPQAHKVPNGDWQKFNEAIAVAAEEAGISRDSTQNDTIRNDTIKFLNKNYPGWRGVVITNALTGEVIG